MMDARFVNDLHYVDMRYVGRAQHSPAERSCPLRLVVQHSPICFSQTVGVVLGPGSTAVIINTYYVLQRPCIPTVQRRRSKLQSERQSRRWTRCLRTFTKPCRLTYESSGNTSTSICEDTQVAMMSEDGMVGASSTVVANSERGRGVFVCDNYRMARPEDRFGFSLVAVFTDLLYLNGLRLVW